LLTPKKRKRKKKDTNKKGPKVYENDSHYFHVCGIKETKGKYDEFGHVSINDLNYAWAFTHHLLLQHWSQTHNFLCHYELRGNRPAYYYKYHAWFPIARGGTVHL
jgi:hypothetical protein